MFSKSDLVFGHKVSIIQTMPSDPVKLNEKSTIKAQRRKVYIFDIKKETPH